jgi:hypothetical protein
MFVLQVSAQAEQLGVARALKCGIAVGGEIDVKDLANIEDVLSRGHRRSGDEPAFPRDSFPATVVAWTPHTESKIPFAGSPVAARIAFA